MRWCSGSSVDHMPGQQKGRDERSKLRSALKRPREASTRQRIPRAQEQTSKSQSKQANNTSVNQQRSKRATETKVAHFRSSSARTSPAGLLDRLVPQLVPQGLPAPETITTLNDHHRPFRKWDRRQRIEVREQMEDLCLLLHIGVLHSPHERVPSRPAAPAPPVAAHFQETNKKSNDKVGAFHRGKRANGGRSTGKARTQRKKAQPSNGERIHPTSE